MVEAADSRARAATGKTRRTRPEAAVGTLRGRIPSLLPAQADTLRYFFAAPERWPLRDGGVLRFAVGRPDAAGEWFELEADGTRLGLRLESADAQHVDEVLQWSDHRGRARLLAWALAHEAQLIRLSDALGVSLLPVEANEPRDTEASQRDPDIWLAFSIEETGRDAVSRGTVRLPASWIDRLLDRAEQVYDDDPPPELGRWQQLPAVVTIRLPGPQLRGADWRAMRPGDVVVIGHRGRAPRPQACATDRRWPLAGSAEGWRIDGPLQSIPVLQESSTMNDNDVHADTAEAGTETGTQHVAQNLPVSLEFDLGSVQMSLGELANLQPGYVFSLPAHLEGANVTIRANGRVSGRGEMVAVGDTLGVRLLSWS